MNLYALRMDLERDEGCRLKPYDDETGLEIKPGDTLVGNLTIGTGRNLHAGISESERLFLMDNDIQTVLHDLDRNVPWWRRMPEPWMRGLANMAFMGWPRLSTFKRMLAALERGDGLSAGDEVLDSKYAGQVGERADRIAALFRD